MTYKHLHVIRSLAAVCLLQLGLANSASADIWAIDKQNSEIRFSWDYLGISRRSGRFLDMDGTLNFAPTDPESGSVELSIKSASVSTGVKELDDTLKSPDFFGAVSYPRIVFKSTGVVKTGERAGDITGELTFHGQSRPVVLSTTWNFTGEHPMSESNVTFQGKWVSGFTATAKFLRSDFGVKRGVPLLSDEVRIDIDAVFIRKD